MKEIIFGLDCVRMALSANRRQIYKLLYYQNSLKPSAKGDAILDAAKKRKIPVQYTTRKELDILLSDRPHQNIALEVSKFEPPVISSPEFANGDDSASLIVFPVNILDPQNLGSIIRSSTFYGCTGLVTSLKHSCDFTPIVSKASAGSMEVFQNLFRTKSPLEFLKNAKSQGFKIIGTGLQDKTCVTYHDHTPNSNHSILMLGNEGNGLSPDILNLCDSNLVISPLLNSNPTNLDSLNVGVATGILLDRLHQLTMYSQLLPPQWQSIYLPLWFQEDFPTLDVATAIVGNSPATAQILFKSETCLMAGIPFLDAIFNYVNCRAEWMVEEGQVISSNGPVRVAVITGPAASLLKAERLALNVLARCTSIATYAHHLSELTSSRLAGTRKTTPGFRLVEKYALAIAGVDPHRQSCTDCIMIKDNHIDLFDGDISDIVKAVKSLASFTTKIEVECRSLVDAENAVESGADIVMFDNFIPSLTDLASLRSFNPRVLIELSGGITPLNIHNYPSDPAIVLSLGSLTHSLPPLLDFSFKISK